MHLNLTHLQASLVFAFFASIVFGVVSKKTDRDRLWYGVYVFSCFLVATFGLGWLMYFGHR